MAEAEQKRQEQQIAETEQKRQEQERQKVEAERRRQEQQKAEAERKRQEQEAEIERKRQEQERQIAKAERQRQEQERLWKIQQQRQIRRDREKKEKELVESRQPGQRLDSPQTNPDMRQKAVKTTTAGKIQETIETGMNRVAQRRQTEKEAPKITDQELGFITSKYKDLETARQDINTYKVRLEFLRNQFNQLGFTRLGEKLDINRQIWDAERAKDQLEKDLSQKYGITPDDLPKEIKRIQETISAVYGQGIGERFNLEEFQRQYQAQQNSSEPEQSILRPEEGRQLRPENLSQQKTEQRTEPASQRPVENTLRPDRERQAMPTQENLPDRTRHDGEGKPFRAEGPTQRRTGQENTPRAEKRTPDEERPPLRPEVPTQLRPERETQLRPERKRPDDEIQFRPERTGPDGEIPLRPERPRTLRPE
jgi:hypothetical protein